MAMGTFLEALASWQGLKRVHEEIASRGFLVPQFYRREMVEYCRANDMDSDLETYWSECAKERIFSGGRVDPIRRRHLENAPYRSAYLDQLMAQRQLMPHSSIPELHPCLRCWIEAKEASKGRSSLGTWDKIQTLKNEECKQHNVFTDGWTGKKKDVKPILRRYAGQNGFSERKLEIRGLESGGKAWCKEKPSGLIFYCWADVGGLTGTGGRLPLRFHISHSEDNLRPCGVGPNTMSMGADYYAVFKSPETAIFGIYALVSIFDAFSSTFS